MVENIKECTTVKNQLTQLGEIVPEKQFIDKVLNIDSNLSYLRPTLARTSIEDVIRGLTDGHSFHYPSDRQPRHCTSTSTE